MMPVGDVRVRILQPVSSVMSARMAITTLKTDAYVSGVAVNLGYLDLESYSMWGGLQR